MRVFSQCLALHWTACIRYFQTFSLCGSDQCPQFSRRKTNIFYGSVWRFLHCTVAVMSIYCKIAKHAL